MTCSHCQTPFPTHTNRCSCGVIDTHILPEEAFFSSLPASLSLSTTVRQQLLQHRKNQITHLYIPEGTTSLNGFQHYHNLQSLHLPKSLKLIQGNTFSHCYHLKTVILPDHLETIEYAAFSHCSSLTQVHIPPSLSYIGTDAFKNTPFLQYLYLHIPDFIPQLLYLNKQILWHGQGIQELSLDHGPNSPSALAPHAFAYDPHIQRVSLPHIKDLGYGCFSHCTSLTHVSLTPVPSPLIPSPNSLKVIPPLAFSHCSSLKSFQFPPFLTHISHQSFRHCHNLQFLDFPSSLQVIQDSAFAFCTALTHLLLPKQLSFLGESSFEHCEQLTSVIFSDSLDIIPFHCFSQCKNLKNFKFPKNLQYIHPYAFHPNSHPFLEKHRHIQAVADYLSLYHK